MSDLEQRFDDVRAAGRRLDAAAAVPLSRAGPAVRNGQAPGGWLKTLFAGPGRARPEAAADRAAYLLMCQSVVAAHVIDRSTTASFPRTAPVADYELRQVALQPDIMRSVRNAARGPAPSASAVYGRARPKTGLAANLAHFLK